MDINELTHIRLDDDYNWNTNRYVARRTWWIKTAHKFHYCTYCSPNKGDNERRDVYPRWKRLRDKNKLKKKGR